MAEFTAITSQEQLDSVIGDRLRRSEEKWQKKYEGFVSQEEVSKITEDLNKKVSDLTNALNDANKKAENFGKEIEDRDTKIKSYELSSIKHRIAHDVGLSYDAIGFLKGDNEESIRDSAEALKSLMGHHAPAFNNEAGQKKVDDVKSSYLAIAKNIK